MTRRLSFRVAPAPQPMLPARDPWPGAALWLVLVAVLSWAVCIGAAWLVAGAFAVVAGVLA